MVSIDDYLRKLGSVGASDLLLSSDRPPLYRAANELLPLPGEGTLPDAQLRAALQQLVTADEWASLLSEQQLAFVANLGNDLRVRGVCSAGLHGISARLSILRPACASIGELQLPATLAALADTDSGLIVVTGPAGSGKSTLVATLLSLIAKQRMAHIATIEDPVEYLQKSQAAVVSQRDVGRHCASHAGAFETALDTSADVIACSSIEAAGAFELAVEAACSGVLVFGELAGHGAANAIEYLLAGVPSAQRAQVCADLAECLAAVIALDLLPKKGGGRVPAAEILLCTPNVASLVRDGKTNLLPGLLDREVGMQSMDRCLLDLASRGVIEGREAYARAIDKRPFAAWQ
jgi:twitching motility protein PilT